MKYLFILNPISGPTKDPYSIVDLIDLEFKESGHDYEFIFTTEPNEATSIAAHANEDGFEIVVAAGGDGTVNEVASGLVYSGTALGIIPLGSGNGIARSYNVPLDIRHSIHHLLKPDIIEVDVGKINDKFFFGVCGMGFDALIGKKFQEFGIRGPVPYFLIGIREYLSYKPEKLRLIFDEQKIEISPLLVTIANTEQYGNSAIIAPDADPQDGLLDICILEPIPIIKAILQLRKMFDGKIKEIPQYRSYRTKKVSIESFMDQGTFHTDGEPHLRERYAEITVLEKAISICGSRKQQKY